MSIDAMKQALHVFKEIYEGLGNVKKSGAHKDTKELATFVRKDCNFAMKDLTQAIAEAEKQEPVAWLQLTAYGDKLLSFNKPSEEKVHYYTSLKLHDPKNIPLYTHPQPKLREKNT